MNPTTLILPPTHSLTPPSTPPPNPQGITNKLDAKMMEAVRQAVETADGVLLVVDSAAEPETVLPMIQGAPPNGPPIAVALNKTDLLQAEEVSGLVRMFKEASSAVQVVLPCVALDGEGVEGVRAWAAGVVPEGPPLYDKVCVVSGWERMGQVDVYVF